MATFGFGALDLLTSTEKIIFSRHVTTGTPGIIVRIELTALAALRIRHGGGYGTLSAVSRLNLAEDISQSGFGIALPHSGLGKH